MGQSIGGVAICGCDFDGKCDLSSSGSHGERMVKTVGKTRSKERARNEEYELQRKDGSQGAGITKEAWEPASFL